MAKHPSGDFSVDPSSEPDARTSLAEFQSRLQFLQLNSDDIARLRTLLTPFRARTDEFVTQFYAHLQSFQETSRFLDGPERLARLQKLQREHFESLLQAEWDEAYVEQRRRVGKRHADVGLPPQLFLGAYAQYIQFCFRSCAGLDEEVPPEYVEKMLTLVKVILLDIGLTLDSYFEQSTQELRRALELYWKSTLDVRQFAQLTSHDLKTPLATIANLCDEALDEFGGQMPAEAAELIAKAQQRTFQTSQMIDELLQSTVNYQNDDAQQNFLTQAMLEEVADRLKPAARLAAVELMLPSDAPLVCGNRIRLREAFYNVIANAIKYNDSDAAFVQVSWQCGGRQIVFRIEDNGPGIPATESERIFAPFRRLPQHRGSPGSGLGLYFAKQLVEESGGHIWLDTTTAEGSVFVISLPEPATSR